MQVLETPKTRHAKAKLALTFLFSGLLTFNANVFAQSPDDDTLVVSKQPTAVTFAGGSVKSGGLLKVRIAGPDGLNVFEGSTKSGLIDWALEGNLEDGVYRFDAWFTPTSALDNGNNSDQPDATIRQKSAPQASESIYETGILEIQHGLIVPRETPKSEYRQDLSSTECCINQSPSTLEWIVGSVLEVLVPAAVAQDITVDDNDPNIRFDDTDGGSVEDWLVSGLLEGFAISDDGADFNSVTGQFAIQSGAAKGSIFVESTSDVGLGTSTPEEALHIANNDPFLLFEDLNETQKWRVLATGTGLGSGFRVNDVTAGTFPFRILAGAPNHMLRLHDDGNIGMGTVSPSAPLHVQRSDGTAFIRVEDTGSTDGLTMFDLLNRGGHPKFRMEDDSQSDVRWEFRTAGTEGFSERFQINKIGSGAINAEFEANGDLTIAGTLSSGSSREIKADIAPVDGGTVLAKLNELPVSEWSYQAERSKRHIGPMAEDFHAAFGLGPDNKHVSPSDLAGVALAAAKALKTETNRLEAEKELLKSENRDLRARLKRIEAKLGLSED